MFQTLVKVLIYTGKAKSVCVPGLNCYSCPTAIGACPIGAFYALFNKISLFKIKFKEDKYVRYGKCVRTCKMDVGVTKNPQHTECIRCDDCIKACLVKALSYNFCLDLKKGGKANVKKIISKLINLFNVGGSCGL